MRLFLRSCLRKQLKQSLLILINRLRQDLLCERERLRQVFIQYLYLQVKGCRILLQILRIRIGVDRRCDPAGVQIDLVVQLAVAVLSGIYQTDQRL